MTLIERQIRLLEKREAKLDLELRQTRRALASLRQINGSPKIRRHAKKYEGKCEYIISRTAGFVEICSLDFQAASAKAKYCEVHRNVQRIATLEALKRKEENKNARANQTDQRSLASIHRSG